MMVDKFAPRILVVDDDELIREQLKRLYDSQGYLVDLASSGEQALATFAKTEDIDLVVTDIKLPGISGLDLTLLIRRDYPDLPIIVITGHGALDNAIESFKGGAIDYIVKPFSAAAIQQSTAAAIERSRVFMEIRHLRRRLTKGGEFGGMLSRTPEMHSVFERIRMVAPTDTTVLVEGETGTGKELVAKAIHYHSPRRAGPFIVVNCAGFPEPLLESELFGHERGAFTGAVRTNVGKVEVAHGGTLFLDEIESMSLGMQSKLLRVLEDQQVQRLGTARKIKVDMRVVTASNVPVEKLVADGKMRTDFYYRVNVMPIRLLPLRERRDDIALLVDDFIKHHRVARQKGVTGVSQSVLTRLMNYDWPGNVRELHNVLEKAIVMATKRIVARVELPKRAVTESANGMDSAGTLNLTQWLAEQEKSFLMHQLKSFDGKVALTAKHCGLTVRTLSRKMHQYGLRKNDFQRKVSQPGIDHRVTVDRTIRSLNPSSPRHS